MREKTEIVQETGIEIVIDVIEIAEIDPETETVRAIVIDQEIETDLDRDRETETINIKEGIKIKEYVSS
jgi:hypothetical protein